MVVRMVKETEWSGWPIQSVTKGLGIELPGQLKRRDYALKRIDQDQLSGNFRLRQGMDTSTAQVLD